MVILIRISSLRHSRPSLGPTRVCSFFWIVKMIVRVSWGQSFWRERRPVVRTLRLSSYWHIGNMRRGFSQQPGRFGEFVVFQLILILQRILNYVVTPNAGSRQK